MRLDKFVCLNVNVTRSLASNYIKKNEILVNGKRVTKKDYKIDEKKDVISINGKVIEYKEYVYYMLNKPRGYVSAVKDNIDKTVIQLIDTNYDIFPVGRLDKDTEGLLILTNDGMLSHNLTSPINNVYKKYYVECDKDLSIEDMEAFKNGIEITDADGNLFVTKEAKIEKVDILKYNVWICEGKYHQVKKMFLYFNSEVTYLKRLAFGNLNLDANLKIGEYRELSEDELLILKEY